VFFIIYVIGRIADDDITPDDFRDIPLWPEPMSPRSPSTQHEFPLMTTKNKPWLTLRLSSLSSAISSKNVPKFFQGEDVAASAALKLHGADAIHSVIVSVSFFPGNKKGCLADSSQVRGRILTCAYDGDSYVHIPRNMTL
jgi:hypothetical protein